MTHLTSPRHSYTDSSPRLSMSQLSLQPPVVHLRRALNHRLVVSSFPQTSQILILPHTCLQQTCISRLPQNHPKRSSPNSVHRIHLKATQVLPCGATWLLEGARPSSSKPASEPQSSSFSLPSSTKFPSWLVSWVDSSSAPPMP
jgi:hypothetical protein